MAEHVYTPTWRYPGAYQQIGTGSVYRSRGDGGNNGRYDNAAFSDGTVKYTTTCDANASMAMCVSDFDGESTTRDIVITVSMGKKQYNPGLMFYPYYRQMRHTGVLTVTAHLGSDGSVLWTKEIDLLSGYYLPDSTYDHIPDNGAMVNYGDRTYSNHLSSCLLDTGVLVSFGYSTIESWVEYGIWGCNGYATNWGIGSTWSGYKFVFIPFNGDAETINTTGYTSTMTYDDDGNQSVEIESWFGYTPYGYPVNNGNELLVYGSSAYLFTGISINTNEGEYILSSTGSTVALAGLTGSYEDSWEYEGDIYTEAVYPAARNMCAIIGSIAYGCYNKRVFGISVSGPINAISSEVTGNPDFWYSGYRENTDTEFDDAPTRRGTILSVSSSYITIITSCDNGLSLNHYIFNTTGIAYLGNEVLVSSPRYNQANSLLGLPSTSSCIYNNHIFYSKPESPISAPVDVTGIALNESLAQIWSDTTFAPTLGISQYYMLGSTSWYSWSTGTQKYAGNGYIILGKEYIYHCLDGSLIAYTVTGEPGSPETPPGEEEDLDLLALSNVPLNGATNVSLDSLVSITFNYAPDSDSINMANIILSDTDGNIIPWTYIITISKTIYLDPWYLPADETITVTALNPVRYTDEDLVRHYLENSPYVFSFSTIAAIIPVPPPLLIPPIYSNGAGRQGILYGVQHFNGVIKGEYQQ